MVKEAHNHTSIHLYIHTHTGRVGCLADLLPARLGQLLRKWASLHRQTMTQAHPRQRDWRARNNIGRGQSQIDQIERAQGKATGVFSSWEGGESREEVWEREFGSQVKIAWSKSRIGDLEFFRVWGEHEAGGGATKGVEADGTGTRVTRGEEEEGKRAGMESSHITTSAGNNSTPRTLIYTSFQPWGRMIF